MRCSHPRGRSIPTCVSTLAAASCRRKRPSRRPGSEPSQNARRRRLLFLFPSDHWPGPRPTARPRSDVQPRTDAALPDESVVAGSNPRSGSRCFARRDPKIHGSGHSGQGHVPRPPQAHCKPVHPRERRAGSGRSGRSGTTATRRLRKGHQATVPAVSPPTHLRRRSKFRYTP